MRRFLTVFALAAALGPSAASAQTVPIDSLARAFAAEAGLPSLVVAVSVGGEREVVALGTVDSLGTAPDLRTLYEIGSITKVLTGIALADAVARGEVALDTPVRDLLPDSAMVSQHASGPIRLWHLSTHTSGLPHIPLEMGFAPGFDMADPYARYDVAALYASLSRPRADTAPGEAMAYSNLAVGLLGHALAHRAGTTYAGLLTDRVLGPLGMRTSFVAVPDSLRAHRAVGHDGGEVTSLWTFPETVVGAGGVVSTAADLLTLGEAALAPEATPLAEALALSLTPRFDLGDGRAVGLGWFLASAPGAPDLTVATHSGGTGGFRSVLAVVPEAGVVVVALTNATVEVDAVGFEVLERLLTREEE